MSLLSSFDTKILLFVWIALDQVEMENRESEKESERDEKTNQSLWTEESFNLAEDTERYEKGWQGMFELELQRLKILTRFDAYRKFKIPLWLFHWEICSMNLVTISLQSFV